MTRAEERSSAGVLLNSWVYSYDASSSRTSQTVNGVATSYTHNAADQLTAEGSTTYSYDANGNELSNSAGRQWTYNAKDQAVSVTPPAASAISMSYTGTGQFERVSAGSTSYTTSGLGLSRENTTSYTRDGGGVLTSMRTGAGTFYYLLDGLGCVAALTDSLGNLAATYSYEPFGKLKSSTGRSAASPLSRRLLFYIVLFGLYSVLLALIAWLGFAVDLIPKSYAAVALVSACIGVIVVVGLAYAYVRHSSLTRADDEKRGSLPAGETRAIDTGDIPLPSMRRVVLIAGVGSVAIIVFALVGIPVWLVLAVFVLSILPVGWIERGGVLRHSSVTCRVLGCPAPSRTTFVGRAMRQGWS